MTAAVFVTVERAKAARWAPAFAMARAATAASGNDLPKRAFERGLFDAAPSFQAVLELRYVRP
jgi:hypothetical protein